MRASTSYGAGHRRHRVGETAIESTPSRSSSGIGSRCAVAWRSCRRWLRHGRRRSGRGSADTARLLHRWPSPAGDAMRRRPATRRSCHSDPGRRTARRRPGRPARSMPATTNPPTSPGGQVGEVGHRVPGAGLRCVECGSSGCQRGSPRFGARLRLCGNHFDRRDLGRGGAHRVLDGQLEGHRRRRAALAAARELQSNDTSPSTSSRWTSPPCEPR